MPPKRKKALLKVKIAAASKTKRKRSPERHDTSSAESDAVASDNEADKDGQQEKEATASKPSQKSAYNEPGSAVSKRVKRKSLTLSDDEEIELAEWIRSNPEIYMKTLKAYKDGAKKQKLWDDKAALLGIQSDLLRVWYESIRTKVGKLSTTMSGSEAKEQTARDKFIMANFNFLKEHIARMKGRTGMSLAPPIELWKSSASQHASSQQATSQHESGGSDAELEESLQDHAPGSPVGPSSPEVDDNNIPLMTRKGKGKGKGKSKTLPTSTITRPLHDSDDEADDIIRQLRLQKKDSGQMKQQIATMLEGEKLTTMTQFGRFIAGLGSQIDERLVCQFYQDTLEVTVSAIRRSHSLPPRPHAALPPTPLPQGAGQHPQQPQQLQQQPQQLQQQSQQFQQQQPQQFQQQSQQFQQQQPQQFQQQSQQLQQQPQQLQQLQQQQSQTYTAMLGTSQQNPGGRAVPWAWDIYQPTAGANTAQLVVPNITTPLVMSPRAQSAPNLSMTSLSQLSDVSQSLRTPDDPSTHPHSPGVTTNLGGTSFTGDGGSFRM